MSRFWLVLLPELRSFAPAERAQALRAARDTAFDAFELICAAGAVVAVTALTRYVLPAGSMAAQFAAVLSNFVVAVPLLAIILAPVYLRKLRRGLRDQLQRRSGS